MATIPQRSGSSRRRYGSTIVCLTLRSPEKVAKVMLQASRLPAAETRVVAADNDGARIVIPTLAPDAPLA